SRARHREGGRAHDHARPAAAPADEAPAHLQGPGTSACRPAARDARRRRAEPQEFEGLSMSETEQTRTLADLRNLAVAAAVPQQESDAPKREPKRDALGRSYATGRRKNAIARVWVRPGKGEITVNGKRVGQYFARPV